MNIVQNVAIALLTGGLIYVARTIRAERKITDQQICRLTPPTESAPVQGGPRFLRPM